MRTAVVLLLFAVGVINGQSVCQNGYVERAGACMKVYKAPKGLTRAKAQAACNADGAHLAFLESAARQQAAQNLLYSTYPETVSSSKCDVWFGGCRDDTINSFVWADQCVPGVGPKGLSYTMSYTHWASGEPNNRILHCICGKTVPNDLTWYDQDCTDSSLHYYICDMDINECLVNNGGCGDGVICTNTPGSFTCSCNSGYTLVGKTCADINECLVNNGGCDARATCTNTPGGFTCKCNAGLNGDGKTCSVCQNGYVDRAGSCFKAYKAAKGLTRAAAQTACNADGAHLAFLDSAAKQQAAQTLLYSTYPELIATSKCDVWFGGCRDDTVNSFVWSDVCVPSVGPPKGSTLSYAMSYTHWASGEPNNRVLHCTCGKTVPNDLTWYDQDCTSSALHYYICESALPDVNECLQNNGGCDSNAKCANTPGSFTCTCNAGFTGDGKTCTDVNECATNNGGCDAHATCTNTPGSFSCSCNSGFTGNGNTCTDVNECATNNGGCDAHASCTNTPGSFTCTCNAGFTGDGKTCTAISYCATHPNPCKNGGTCQQYGDSYSCQCKSGFAGVNCELDSAACKAIADKKRVNCGWGGVTSDQCNNRTCCYDELAQSRNAATCYYSKDLCSAIPSNERVDCGTGSTINELVCNGWGCCWDQTAPISGLQCYRMAASPSCIGVPASKRVPTVKRSTIPNDCEANGGCWDSSIRGDKTLWCFTVQG